MAIDPTPHNVAHLLRRAAFGGTPEEIADGVDRGIEATVDALFDATRAPELVEPGREVGTSPYEVAALNLWFVHLAATSPTPAIERLLWFWHGHFATSFEKVEAGELVFRHLAMLRNLSLGRFEDLLVGVTHDPAMNLWLDLSTSIAGSPNENYAREIMELFSLGAANGYTQSDVVEAARAFTGYQLEHDPRTQRPIGTRLSPALHDYGPKTIFGRTDNFDGADVIDLIVQRPECHRFVAGRMWLRYAGTVASPSVLEDLAAAFGKRRSVHDLVVAVCTHPEFYTDTVKDGLVTQPVEAVVRAVRGFGLSVADPGGQTLDGLDDLAYREDRGTLLWEVLDWLEVMGQLVALPPNVGGWAHNEAWLGTNRAAGRLLAGIALGETIASVDTPTTGRLFGVVGHPSELTAELMAGFGVVSWSPATEAAIAAASRTGEPDADLAAAVAVAFTSPEVTLS